MDEERDGGRNPQRDEERELSRWGLAVKELLSRRGWSQAEVERRVGWTRGYLSGLLRGTPPDLKIRHLVRVFEVTGAQVAELVAILGEFGGAGEATLAKAEIEILVERRVRSEVERAREVEAARREAELGKLREEVRRLLRRRGLPVDPEDLQGLVEGALVEVLERMGLECVRGKEAAAAGSAHETPPAEAADTGPAPADDPSGEGSSGRG